MDQLQVMNVMLVMKITKIKIFHSPEVIWRNNFTLRCTLTSDAHACSQTLWKLQPFYWYIHTNHYTDTATKKK